VYRCDRFWPLSSSHCNVASFLAMIFNSMFAKNRPGYCLGPVPKGTQDVGRLLLLEVLE
jgi:hypothetical protein